MSQPLFKLYLEYLDLYNWEGKEGKVLTTKKNSHSHDSPYQSRIIYKHSKTVWLRWVSQLWMPLISQPSIFQILLTMMSWPFSFVVVLNQSRITWPSNIPNLEIPIAGWINCYRSFVTQQNMLYIATCMFNKKQQTLPLSSYRTLFLKFSWRNLKCFFPDSHLTFLEKYRRRAPVRGCVEESRTDRTAT